MFFQRECLVLSRVQYLCLINSRYKVVHGDLSVITEEHS